MRRDEERNKERRKGGDGEVNELIDSLNVCVVFFLFLFWPGTRGGEVANTVGRKSD